MDSCVFCTADIFGMSLAEHVSLVHLSELQTFAIEAEAGYVTAPTEINDADHEGRDTEMVRPSSDDQESSLEKDIPSSSSRVSIQPSQSQLLKFWADCGLSALEVATDAIKGLGGKIGEAPQERTFGNAKERRILVLRSAFQKIMNIASEIKSVSSYINLECSDQGAGSVELHLLEGCEVCPVCKKLFSNKPDLLKHFKLIECNKKSEDFGNKRPLEEDDGKDGNKRMME